MEDFSKWSKSRIVNFIKFLQNETYIDIELFLRIYDEVERGN